MSLRFDRASYSWRIARALFHLEGLPDASPTLPRSGMMRRGILSERDTLAHRTGAIDAGSLPQMATPTATANQLSPSMMKHPGCRAWFPTPTDASKGGGTSRSGPRRNECPSLHGMARHNRWPTPSARDWKDTPGMTAQRKDGKSRDDQLPRRVYSRDKVPAGGGKLSPTWVEWLMGWPIGWTDCEPLGMDRYHRWPRSPFKPCVPDSTAGGEE